MCRITKNFTDFQKIKLLQINSCGSERITKSGYTIYRPYGRADFHFLYLKEGWMKAEIGDKKITLSKGECAVFYPDIKQKYTFSKDGNPVSLYLHFTGDAAAEAMDYVNKQYLSVYRISERVLFESLFEKLIRVHNLKMPAYIPEENGLLLQLISIIAKESNQNKPPKRIEILNAIEYLSSHIAENIDINSFAKEFNLSCSRFVHLFSETAGISPHQFLLKLRLDRACYLLKYSTMSIGDIAKSIGYDDSYYFSRIFKKKYLVSPKDYRKQNKPDNRTP